MLIPKYHTNRIIDLTYMCYRLLLLKVYVSASLRVMARCWLLGRYYRTLSTQGLDENETVLPRHYNDMHL